MKRFLMAVVWFFVIFFIGLFLMGMLYAAFSPKATSEATSLALQSTLKGFTPWWLVLSIILSVAGTVTRILPGTKKAQKAMASVVEELEALSKLRDAGILTENEFETRKEALLD